MKRIILALALVGALIITCFTGCEFNSGNNALEGEKANAVAVFTIDVNPGIRVYVDEDNNVIVIEATNEDGETIVTELDVEGVDLETVIEQIIDKMEEKGYIRGDENSVLISIEKQDKDISEKVNQKVEESFEKHGKKASLIEQEIDKLEQEMDDEIREIAEKYGISKGKARLIQKIREEFPELSEEELAKLGINDLRMMLEDTSDDVKEDFKQIGKPIEDAYVGRELALAIALDALELSEDDVSMERVHAKFREGAMLYEVKLVAADMEHEVVINAKTGDVLKIESKEFEEFDPKAEIDEFCGKHGVDFDDVKNQVNDAFGKHDHNGDQNEHEGNHNGGHGGEGNHDGEGDSEDDDSVEDRPLTKGEILKGLMKIFEIPYEILEKTDVQLYETESGTVYSVTIELNTSDVYTFVIEAYSGTILKAELNGAEIEINLE